MTPLFDQYKMAAIESRMAVDRLRVNRDAVADPLQVAKALYASVLNGESRPAALANAAVVRALCDSVLRDCANRARVGGGSGGGDEPQFPPVDGIVK